MTATVRTYSVIESSPTIYQLVHCTHTTYNMAKTLSETGIMYKTILILILILFYYRPTIYFR